MFLALKSRWRWRPIPGCPGRFVFADGPTRLSPGEITGAAARTEHIVTPARDPVVVTSFDDGGLISYCKADGTYLHTLNSREGFERKLRQLGIMLTLLVAVLLAAPAAAERAKSPADATVFIRLIGSVRLEVDDGLLNRRTVDLDQVEVGTGSGFIISPHGYVLTNEHVVSSDQFLITKGMQQVRVTLNVSAIHVCLRADTAAARGLSSPCVTANLVSADPALDLAVLFISGSDLPYIALGDSDVVAAGLAVDALGYPLGREVEVARTVTAPDFVPDVSTTPGAISALRANDAGDRRYLQITNSLNPGNSGGPVVNREGYAVGVAQMRLRNAASIGFAIPINQAKDFLESRGIDQALPVRRLRLGGFHNLELKRVGLRLPEGLVDTSPFRSRVETDPQAAGVVLRIDRVLSPWSLRQIEQALIGTPAFEPFALVARDRRAVKPLASSLLLGAATAADIDREVGVEYGLLDLKSEKLVARYVGPAEWLAFNESVLRESLSSLQGQAWGERPARAVDAIDWAAIATEGDGRLPFPAPVGWMISPSAPSACSGVAPPATVMTALPPDELGVALRAGLWTANDIEPEAAAARCSPRRGSLGAASYLTRADWLGVSYVVEGVFVRVGPAQLAQLEVSATSDRATSARAMLAEWAKRAQP